MNSLKAHVEVRASIPSDAVELCTILNEIIDIGGTTASEIRLSEDEFRSRYFQGENHISCFTAIDEMGRAAGFQSLKYNAKLSEVWADIATFARIKPKVAGVGTALFDKSKSHAKQSGFTTINATIRADNSGGLRFYEKMGFETYLVDPDVPLISGLKVDRISKRFILR